MLLLQMNTEKCFFVLHAVKNTLHELSFIEHSMKRGLGGSTYQWSFPREKLSTFRLLICNL